MLVFVGLTGVCLASQSENADQDGLYSLGEIVVSGEKSEVTMASTHYQITADEIKNMGATTLSDVLALVPGISIRVGGAGTPRVDIRGFKTRHVLLLLDGIPINDTYDGQFDPTSFPVEHIAQVKVITGGGSVLYGPGGNGGVINIITKKGRQGLHGSVGGEYGTEDAWLARAALSGGTEKLDFFISANREYKPAFPLSDDFEPTTEEDGASRENSDFERNSLFTNLGYTLSDNTQMGMTLNWYQGENGVPPTSDSDPADPFNKRSKYVRVDDLEGFSAQLAFNHKMDSPIGIRGWIYRNQQDVLENRYDDATYTSQVARNSYENNTSTAITGINTQIAYDPTQWLKGTLGLSYENHTWDADGFEMIAGSGGGSTPPVKTLFESDEDIEIKSLALECELSPREAYGFVLGFSQHFMEGSGVESDQNNSFILGSRYDVTDKTRLKASYSKKVRFASLRQLYDVDYGNPDLETEKTYQYDVGLVQKLPAESSLSISCYYSEVEDYIEKITGPYENLEEYLFKGVDVSVENRFFENLILGASYSYLDSKDKSPATERDELQYRPRNKYTLGCTYTVGFGLMLHTDILHMADQYYYADGTSPLLKRKLNDFTVVNAKISQSLINDTVTVYVRGQNLFDEDFEQSYDLPQAGRTVYGGCDVRF